MATIAFVFNNWVTETRMRRNSRTSVELTTSATPPPEPEPELGAAARVEAVVLPAEPEDAPETSSILRVFVAPWEAAAEVSALALAFAIRVFIICWDEFAGAGEQRKCCVLPPLPPSPIADAPNPPEGRELTTR